MEWIQLFRFRRIEIPKIIYDMNIESEIWSI